MVKHYSEQLDRTFFALSDPTRRAIIGNLAAKGSCSVLELAEPFNMSLPAISKHLKLLENANLIRRTKTGRVHNLELVASPMKEANSWLESYARFWTQQFDNFERYLQSQESEERSSGGEVRSNGGEARPNGDEVRPNGDEVQSGANKPRSQDSE